MSGFECDSICTESQATLNVWHHRKKFGAIKFDSCRGHGHLLSQSIRHYEFDCWYTCVHVCVLTHLCVCFSIEGYFWGSNSVKFFEPNLSQRVWHEMCFVFFVFVKKKKKKSSFVAKCTCEDFALKWLSCRSGAVEERSRERRFEVCRNLLGVLQ